MKCMGSRDELLLRQGCELKDLEEVVAVTITRLRADGKLSLSSIRQPVHRRRIPGRLDFQAERLKASTPNWESYVSKNCGGK
jgi:hypothetical protein